MPWSPPIRFCTIVGHASIHTARAIGPSTMERSRSLGILDKLSRQVYLTYRLNMTATTRKSDRLTSTFAALADPTRRAMLARLSTGQATVTELAAPFAMSLPAVSKHLKVLERAGLVARDREAQWRPSRLKADRLKDVADWVERYRRF